MPKIINFHEITNPAWFEQTLQLLISLYKPCKVEDIKHFYAGKKISPHSFLITVDDGSLTDYTVIYPLLKKYDLQAVIFVSPYIAKSGKNFWFQEIAGYNENNIRDVISYKFNISRELIQDFYPSSMLKNMRIEDILDIINIYKKKYNEPDKPRKNMSVKELKELKESGHFIIGAHTQTHPILANETYEISKKEITHSVQELSDIINNPVEFFAYPNGKRELDYGKRELDFLKENSVNYAFSFEYKNMRKNDDKLNIPRFGLSHGSPSKIKKMLQFGEYWENLKNVLFNNENKHRKLIKSKVDFY